MKKFAVISISLLIFLALAFPFVRDAWAWHQISTRFALNDSQRAALHNWAGSPEGFVDMLRAQCLRENDARQENCLRYR